MELLNRPPTTSAVADIHGTLSPSDLKGKARLLPFPVSISWENEGEQITIKLYLHRYEGQWTNNMSISIRILRGKERRPRRKEVKERSGLHGEGEARGNGEERGNGGNIHRAKVV